MLRHRSVAAELEVVDGHVVKSKIKKVGVQACVRVYSSRALVATALQETKQAGPPPRCYDVLIQRLGIVVRPGPQSGAYDAPLPLSHPYLPTSTLTTCDARFQLKCC